MISNIYAKYRFWDRFYGDFNRQFLLTIEKIRQIGAIPIVLLEMPSYDSPVPRILAHESVFQSDPYFFWKKSYDRQYLLTNATALLNEIEDKGGLVVDPKPLFLDSNSKSYPGFRDAIILFRDGGHLTPGGARAMLAEKFQNVIAETIDKY
jgi:hypothetical protein